MARDDRSILPACHCEETPQACRRRRRGNLGGGRSKNHTIVDLPVMPPPGRHAFACLGVGYAPRSGGKWLATTDQSQLKC
jgi:hypothetical protein